MSVGHQREGKRQAGQPLDILLLVYGKGVGKNPN